MLRLKEITIYHTKNTMIMTIAFRGKDNLSFTFSPDTYIVNAWTHFEGLLRTAALDSIRPSGVHEVEEFYPDDPTEGCTCGASVGSAPWFHMSDCPLHQAPRQKAQE